MQRPRLVVLTAYGSIHLAVEATRLGGVGLSGEAGDACGLRLSVACVLEEPNAAAADPEATYGQTLRRVQQELFQGDIGQAEALLMRAADEADNDPAYFNLLGVVYETEGRRQLARKCYMRALALDPDLEAAKKNIQRLREILAGRQSPLVVSPADRKALRAAVGVAASTPGT